MQHANNPRTAAELHDNIAVPCTRIMHGINACAAQTASIAQVPVGRGETTGSVTMDAAVAWSQTVDTVTSFGKTSMPFSAACLVNWPSTSRSCSKAEKAPSLSKLKTCTIPGHQCNKLEACKESQS